ncbi:DUF4159 domain-containing protein [Flavobacterium sp.]|jgi:hypothetical protein|uniref:DUF4159 domain-containing protein n=1 Tax=Flavobacterium sp. TaxID=239 RepID=UPI0037C0DB5C
MNKLLLLFFLPILGYTQEVAVLKYTGGGDWYANPTSLPNLVAYCNQNINTSLTPKVSVVDVGSAEIVNYPLVHMTGHGNVIFSENDVQNLKNYLTSGGFLHVDDNYGMDEFIRREIKKVFPNTALVEIPLDHLLFKEPFAFPNGLPKIHEHDNKRPQAFGIFIEGRLVILYTLECDLGDGWENAEVHNDPIQIREKALKMGANIINYVFKN